MKKICLLLCCFLLIQTLCSCSAKKEEFRKPVNFHYCRREMTYNSTSAVIQPETREGFGYHGNIVAFLQAYLRGPVSEDLETLIPADVYLVSCSVEEGIADVVFSSQFSKLSGVKLSTTCSAILLSVHEFADIATVRISAKDAQLDGKDVVVLSLEDVILLDAVKIQD